MKKQLLLILTVLTCPLIVNAELINYGPNSASLTIGAGARATGLGGAFTALADDATAGYWNPAGLGQMNLYLYGAAMQYVYLPNDAFGSYLAYAFQLPTIGSFALSWTNVTIGSIQKRDAAGQPGESFTTYENVIYLSYGRKSFDLLKGLYLGASLKLLQQHLGQTTGLGHGLDVGMIWQPILYLDHTIGLAVQNIYQPLYWQEGSAGSDLTPTKIKAGTALKFFASEEAVYFNHLILTIDIDIALNDVMDYHAGVEYWQVRQLAIRAGVNSRELTAGASYRPKHYQLDYAFHYDLSELANHQHRFSILLRL